MPSGQTLELYLLVASHALLHLLYVLHDLAQHEQVRTAEFLRAQRLARWQQLDAQRLLEEGIAAEVLDGVKVALALHQKTQVAAQDVAVGNPVGNGQRGINLLEHRRQLIQVMTHRSQTRYRCEIVVQLLD